MTYTPRRSRDWRLFLSITVLILAVLAPLLVRDAFRFPQAVTRSISGVKSAARAGAR